MFATSRGVDEETFGTGDAAAIYSKAQQQLLRKIVTGQLGCGSGSVWPGVLAVTSVLSESFDGSSGDVKQSGVW